MTKGLAKIKTRESGAVKRDSIHEESEWDEKTSNNNVHSGENMFNCQVGVRYGKNCYQVS